MTAHRDTPTDAPESNQPTDPPDHDPLSAADLRTISSAPERGRAIRDLYYREGQREEIDTLTRACIDRDDPILKYRFRDKHLTLLASYGVVRVDRDEGIVEAGPNFDAAAHVERGLVDLHEEAGADPFTKGFAEESGGESA